MIANLRAINVDAYVWIEFDKSYPQLIGECLSYARVCGLSFDDAWREATLIFPPHEYDYGFPGSNGRGSESPLMFMKRHMRAAYYGLEAERYCHTDGCTRFAEYDGLCRRHALEAAAA